MGILYINNVIMIESNKFKNLALYFLSLKIIREIKKSVIGESVIKAFS